MFDWQRASAIAISVFCASGAAKAHPHPEVQGGSSPIQPGFPNVSTISAQNAAGLLGFCVGHKYISPARASPVINGLLKQPGISSSSGYELGQKGLIVSAHRGPMNFTDIPRESKGEACEAVLRQGSKLLVHPGPSVADRPTSTDQRMDH